MDSEAKAESNSGDASYHSSKSFFPDGFSPGNNDVLIGRGKKCSNASGNLRLSRIVESRLDEYSAAETKNEKSEILSSVVSEVRNSKPPGGFIKLDPEAMRWYDVGDFMAREKISQTFRNILSDDYRSSTDQKKQRRQSRIQEEKTKDDTHIPSKRAKKAVANIKPEPTSSLEEFSHVVATLGAPAPPLPPPHMIKSFPPVGSLPPHLPPGVGVGSLAPHLAQLASVGSLAPHLAPNSFVSSFASNLQKLKEMNDTMDHENAKHCDMNDNQLGGQKQQELEDNIETLKRANNQLTLENEQLRKQYDELIQYNGNQTIQIQKEKDAYEEKIRTLESRLRYFQDHNKKDQDDHDGQSVSSLQNQISTLESTIEDLENQNESLQNDLRKQKEKKSKPLLLSSKESVGGSEGEHIQELKKYIAQLEEENQERKETAKDLIHEIEYLKEDQKDAQEEVCKLRERIDYYRNKFLAAKRS